jgi:diketogulonate reductase-like aldo/keto reductase
MLTRHVQLNPWVQEKSTVKYCEEKGIVLQAYSPLAVGKRLDDPTVGEIAKHYNKSPAQVLIRYSLQKGWVPLPKTTHRERMVENTKIYDFKINAGDMATLDGLDGSSVQDDL